MNKDKRIIDLSLCRTYLLFRQAAEECPVGPIVATFNHLKEAIRSFGYLPEEAEAVVARNKRQQGGASVY